MVVAEHGVHAGYGLDAVGQLEGGLRHCRITRRHYFSDLTPNNAHRVTPRMRTLSGMFCASWAWDSLRFVSIPMDNLCFVPHTMPVDNLCCVPHTVYSYG